MPETLTYIPYPRARECICSADVLLFAVGKMRTKKSVDLFVGVDELIARAGRSVYSHAGLAAWWIDPFQPTNTSDRLVCLDTVAFRGGGHALLSRLVEQNSGLIDVYGQTTCSMNRNNVVKKMLELTGEPYGRRSFLECAAIHFPIIRFFKRPCMDDEANGTLLHCSGTVSRAYRLGDGVDLVPNLADKHTEPGDLARSGLLRYRFTLVTGEENG